MASRSGFIYFEAHPHAIERESVQGKVDDMGSSASHHRHCDFVDPLPSYSSTAAVSAGSRILRE